MNRATFAPVWAISAILAMANGAVAANVYLQHNLVSDLAGKADHTDPNLVNPWGNAFSATGPFWLSDNGTGLSTVYNSTGTPSATVVKIPGPAGASGSPTGIVFNSTTGFEVAAGKPASFIFATEEGTISAWNSSVDGTHAILKVDNSTSGANYKGLVLATAGSASFLYAANFRAGTIDVFDSTFAPVKAAGGFKDPAIPSGFTPFNIASLGGKLYVAYAQQDSTGYDSAANAGAGYVDVYDTSGNLVSHLISGGALNSPWGMAIAGVDFGDFSGDLLVANFGDGLVNAFDPTSGKFLGVLQDKSGNPIKNDGLWDLHFGNGGNGGDTNALYFTAGIGGPDGQTHGLFGSIQASPAAAAAANAGSYQSDCAMNTWISIFGANMASTTRSWQATDFVNGKLPTQLDGVTVTVDGKPAYVAYVSPKQINALVPVDGNTGAIQVQTANNGLTGPSITAQLKPYSPAFFLFPKNSVAALHADGTPVGATTLFPNSSTPAKPGEAIELYGTGFGQTVSGIPDGQLVSGQLLLTTTPTVLIGGINAQVTYAGLTGAGLYQLDVVVPAGTPDGDMPVVAQIAGFSTQTALITVQH